jgi:uncharacterized low-complexity protein
MSATCWCIRRINSRSWRALPSACEAAAVHGVVARWRAEKGNGVVKCHRRGCARRMSAAAAQVSGEAACGARRRSAARGRAAMGNGVLEGHW